ncbi:nitroreductase [Moraxella macacae 0408225]|uniref:Nitroreductase n=1 Tax=Moraxella macacae 0408225 TaxID=1230338 RepID=L2F5V6_9GAMM|nr:nitroreductase family protein [Moraxella macacae]ELA08146.1 nitroreductase [Moraxella macacae 0408225]
MKITDPTQVNFYDVITSRRSVRRFTDTPIPNEVIDACLDMAMLAPNSSNLQPWAFYVIETPHVHQKVVKYCMNQNAARTAKCLIVCVARGDTWRQNSQDNIKYYPVKPVPKAVKNYYGKLMPFGFSLGKFNAFVPAKWALTQAVRQVRGAFIDPMYSQADVKNWALISTSLACQNLMLAFRSFGFDTCPMGGFDEGKLKKLLKLNEHQYVCMVLAVGERDSSGIYSEQYRFDKKRFVIKV